MTQQWTARIAVELNEADGSWAVIENVEEPCEINNYGLLAAGFPDEASAQEWLENYRLERQCAEWEEHAHQDEPRDPMPF